MEMKKIYFLVLIFIVAQFANAKEWNNGITEKNFGVPSVVVTNTTASPTTATSIVFRVTFSEDVTGFGDVDADVTIGGTAGATSVAFATVDAQTYDVTVTGMTNSGTVTLAVPAAVCVSDADAQDNTSSPSDGTVTFDTVPTVVVDISGTMTDPTTATSIVFDIVFSEAVTGFTDNVADVTIGGTAGATSAAIATTGNPAEYTVTITGMINSGTVSLQIPANATIPIGGSGTATSALSNLSSIVFDTTPTVTIEQGSGMSDPTAVTSIVFDVVFSEAVTNFDDNANDVDISGTAGATSASIAATGDPSIYTVTITGMTGAGTVIASIPASAANAQGGSGSATAASTSTDNSITFTSVVPTVTINQVGGQVDPVNDIGGSYSVEFDVVFSVPVTGFTDIVNDLIVTFDGGGPDPTVNSIVANSSTSYTIIMDQPNGGEEGNITVSIPAGAAQAISGANLDNAASTSTDNVVYYDDVYPSLSSLSPADNATGISTSTTIITATFDENMQLDVTPGTGNDVTIELYKGNSSVIKMQKTNGGLSVSGNTLTIDLAHPDISVSLDGGATYKIRVGSDFIEDISGTNGNNFSGFAKESWEFTTSSSSVSKAIVTACDNGRYVTFDDIVITEADNNDFNSSGSFTVAFTQPGFVLETGVGSVTYGPATGTGTDITSANIDVNLTSITVNFVLDGSNNKDDEITISGLRVLMDGSQTNTDFDISSGAANLGLSDLTLASISQGTVPPTPLVNYTTQSLCEGESLTPPTVTGGGYNYITWYSDASLTTILRANDETPSNAQLGIDPNAAGTYTVYVTETNGCESDPETITVTVNSGTTADILLTSGSNTVCINYYEDKDGLVTNTQESITFEAFPTGANNYRFFNAGGDLQNSSSSIFTTNSITSGNVQVEITNGGCTATSSAISVNVVSAPAGVSLTLPSSSYPDNQGTAVSLTGNPLPGTFDGNGVFGNEFFPNVAGIGNHVLKFTSTNSGCAATIENEVNVYDHVGAISGLPIQMCEDDSDITINSLTGSLPINFTQIGGTELLTSGAIVSPNTFKPSLAPVGTYKVSVLYANLQVREQNITIFALPSKPITTTGEENPAYCTGDNFSNAYLSIVGIGINWYRVPTPGGARTLVTGIPDLENPSLTNLGLVNNVASTYYFEITQTIGVCEGEAMLITVTVNSTPNAINANLIPEYCSGEDLANITLVSGDLEAGATTNFYSGLLPNSDPDEATILKSKFQGLTYDPLLELEIDNEVAINTTYKRYVTQSKNGCESDTKLVELLVKEVPDAPILNNPDPYCQNETINHITILTGSNVKWYSDELLNNELGPFNDSNNVSAAELSIDNSISAEHVFYVTSTTNDCPSEATKVTVSIVELPNPIITNFDESALCKTKTEFVIDAEDNDGTANDDGIWSGTAFAALKNINSIDGTATFDPAHPDLTAGGSFNLIYTVTAANNCVNSVTKNFSVKTDIIADFTIDDACDGDNVAINDNSSLVPDNPGESVDNYEWNFGDTYEIAGSGIIPPGTHDGSTVGTFKELTHNFKFTGEFDVTLTVTNSVACVATVTKKINIGIIPDIDFTWENVAEDLDTELTAVVHNLDVDADIAEFNWSYDGGAPQNLSKSPSENFPLGTHSVQLEILSNENCASDTTKQVYVVPRIEAISNTYQYQENFEDNIGGNWIIGGVNPSWEAGIPTGDTINADLIKKNNMSWVTNLDGNYNVGEQSWVHSPSFDLSGADRPFIRFDLIKLTQESIDGAVLQINTSNKTEDDSQWETLGSIGSGINWYNKSGIIAKPGNQSSQDLGWSGNEDGVEWVTAAYALDAYTSFSRVRFRFAFASSDNELPTDQVLEGFAFDNFFVGQRNRSVLFENFTNNTSAAVLANDAFYGAFKQAVDLSIPYNEIVKLEYHTPFPGTDQLYEDNQADQSARTSYYGLTTTSKGFMDGQQIIGNYTEEANEAFIRASLIPTDFEMSILPDLEPTDNMITPEVNIRVIGDSFEESQLRVHLVVAEKLINDDIVLGSNGQDEYKYVVKKMLPSSAGTLWEGPFNKDDEFSVKSEFDLGNFYNTDNLVLIAFIQDEENKTVHQAIAVDYDTFSGTVTGIDDKHSSLSIYPIPAKNELLLDYPGQKILAGNIVDLTGKNIQSFEGVRGVERKVLDVSMLRNGLYLLHLQLESGTAIVKKFEIRK